MGAADRPRDLRRPRAHRPACATLLHDRAGGRAYSHGVWHVVDGRHRRDQTAPSRLLRRRRRQRQSRHAHRADAHAPQPSRTERTRMELISVNATKEGRCSNCSTMGQPPRACSRRSARSTRCSRSSVRGVTTTDGIVTAKIDVRLGVAGRRWRGERTRRALGTCSVNGMVAHRADTDRSGAVLIEHDDAPYVWAHGVLERPGIGLRIPPTSRRRPRRGFTRSHAWPAAGRGGCGTGSCRAESRAGGHRSWRRGG